jgi:hypothetical protein
MALRAGKKIKAAAASFQQERTQRVKARQRRKSRKQQEKTKRVQARQTGKTTRTADRQMGKVGKAQAIGAGGGYIGRQDMFGRVGEAGIKAGVAAATGGASVLADGLGGLMGGLPMIPGEGPVNQSSNGSDNGEEETEELWYENPLVLGGIAIGVFFLLNRKK